MGLEPGLGGKSGAGQAGLQRSWKEDRCEPGRAGDRDVAKGEVALREEFGLLGYLLKNWVAGYLTMTEWILEHDAPRPSVDGFHQQAVVQPWHGPTIAWPNYSMAQP